jgi:glycosyltransferase 2 family protein
MKKKGIAAAQVLLGGLILTAIFRGLRSSELLDAVREAATHPVWLALGVGTFTVSVIVCSLRWDLLMRAQGMRLPFRTVLRLFFIGHFFNAFLFGATGGDLVKAYLTTLEIPDKRTEAVTTVFIDRLIGLLALVLLAVAIMLVRLPFFMAHTRTRALLGLNAVALGMAVLVFFMVFRRNLFERSVWFRRLEARTSLGKILSRAYNAMHVCMRHPARLGVTLLLSVINHTMLVVMAFFFGRALAIALPFSAFMTVFPIINAVAAIPVTPGGLGTREAMSQWLLGVQGVEAARAVPLSLLLYGGMMLWSLVGGLVYVADCARQARAGRSITLQAIREGAAQNAPGPEADAAPGPEDPDRARP